MKSTCLYALFFCCCCLFSIVKLMRKFTHGVCVCSVSSKKHCTYHWIKYRISAPASICLPPFTNLYIFFSIHTYIQKFSSNRKATMGFQFSSRDYILSDGMLNFKSLFFWRWTKELSEFERKGKKINT